MTVDQEIGALIREARIKAALSQEELGVAVHHAHAAISLLEHGKQSLKARELWTFAAALNVRPADLLPVRWRR